MAREGRDERELGRRIELSKGFVVRGVGMDADGARIM